MRVSAHERLGAHLSLPVVNCRKARFCSRLSPCSTSQNQRTAWLSLRGPGRGGASSGVAAGIKGQQRRQKSWGRAHPGQGGEAPNAPLRARLAAVKRLFGP